MIPWDFTADSWQGIQPEVWGVVLRSTFSPMFPATSIASLGFTQDSDFIYIPLNTIVPTGLSWQSFTVVSWQDMTAAQWQGIVPSQAGASLSANQLYYLLLLKLQLANLSAHQVKINGNFFTVDSRAWATSDFSPGNY